MMSRFNKRVFLVGIACVGVLAGACSKQESPSGPSALGTALPSAPWTDADLESAVTSEPPQNHVTTAAVATALAAPTGVDLRTLVAGSATINWVNNAPTATRTEIAMDDAKSQVRSFGPVGPVTISGLNPGTSIHYYLRSCAATCSPWTGVVGLTANGADAPPPTITPPATIVNLAIQIEADFFSSFGQQMLVVQRSGPSSTDGRALRCRKNGLSDPGGICELSYRGNTVLELFASSAVPFKGWDRVAGRTGPFCENAASTGLTCRLTLTNSTTVKARFGR